MPEFKIRVEFDVEVDNPSHIDAAFEAADWLQERAAKGRFSYLVYEVQKHGTDEWKSVDLEQIEPEYNPDEEPCILAEEHVKGQRHRWQECPTYHEGDEK